MKYLNIQAIYENNKVLPFEFNGRLSGTTGAMRQIFNVPEMFIKECILKEYITPSDNKEKIFLSHYELMCDFMLNKINYKKVEEVLKRNDYGGLVYCRGTIKVIIEDKNIRKLIEQYYKNEDIEYCLNTIKKENKAKISYIKRNEEISEYMAERDTRLKNINWYE